MPQAWFELAVPNSERPQTHALDRAATGTGKRYFCVFNQFIYFYDNI